MGTKASPSILVPGHLGASPATYNTCACTHPLHAPLSVLFLHPCGSCPGVHVSVCLSCACGSWRPVASCVCRACGRQGRGRSSRGLSGWCRCAEQPPAGSLLALEPMPTFGKGLDLRRAAEEAFEVKDVLNSTLDTETLKQTLYRQAKNQVGTRRALPAPRGEARAALPLAWPPRPAWGPRTRWPTRAHGIG